MAPIVLFVQLYHGTSAHAALFSGFVSLAMACAQQMPPLSLALAGGQWLQLLAFVHVPRVHLSLQQCYVVSYAKRAQQPHI